MTSPSPDLPGIPASPAPLGDAGTDGGPVEDAPGRRAPDGALGEQRLRGPALPVVEAGEAAGTSPVPVGDVPAPTPAGGDAVRNAAPLAGQAWRDAVQAAQSQQAGDRIREMRRPRRGKPKPLGNGQAGMNRRMPPGGGDAA